MNVFESVKMGVSMTEAAEMYGVTVNRSRKALCPFHNDRHPSLFVADDHYHCFTCGEHGDVIDFVARADLEHELVMVDDDMKMEALKSTHYLKSLITAEMPMDLERKGEQSYQGEMYVRFLAFSNGDLESLYDHSDGFYRRQLILSVKKKPLDREDDPFLADKLVSEIEGIFLWCLDGLRRLIANNYRFTESSRTKDNREQARRDADNVLLFLRSDGYIRLKADSSITSALYAIYCIWCNDNAYKPLAARTVSMTLKKHADEFGLEHDNHITNSLGKQVNGFWGIEALISPGIL